MMLYQNHLITILHKVRIIVFIILGYFVLPNSIIAQSYNAVIDSIQTLIDDANDESEKLELFRIIAIE